MSLTYMDTERIDHILDEVGFRTYTTDELLAVHESMVQQITEGLENPVQPEDLRHLNRVLAIPSYIQPIQRSEVQHIPVGSMAISAACGGTNWLFSVSRMEEDGRVRVGEPVAVTIPEEKRVHTFSSLVDIIADGVAAAAKAGGAMQTENMPIGIAFGFPQMNIRMPNGDIDARIMMKRLPKHWRVTDCDETLSPEEQPSLVDALREKLIARGMQSPGRIVVLNDAVAVCLDVQQEDNLPAGFVFGTGINGVMTTGDERGIVNLEIGYALTPPTVHHQMMADSGHALGAASISDRTGGGQLPYRVATALRAVQQECPRAEEIALAVLQSPHQAFVSDCAAGNMPIDFALPLTQEETELLTHISQRAMLIAGQSAALIVSSVVASLHQSPRNATFLFEGSLLTKAWGVADACTHALQTVLPEWTLVPQEASGMAGVAKLALVQSLAHKMYSIE